MRALPTSHTCLRDSKILIALRMFKLFTFHAKVRLVSTISFIGLYICSHYLYVLFVSGMFEKRQKESSESDKKQSDVDEAVLLKDWDFARFFPSKSGGDKEEKRDAQRETELKRAQIRSQSRLEMEDAWAKYKAIATPPSRHKQLFQKPSEKSTQDKLSDILKYKKEQDSELNSPNRFFRGFRRENSDFFPLPSTRHSAIYFPKHDSQIGASKQLRSSGFFNNTRKQGTKSSAMGEPILTDFIKMSDSLKASARGEAKKSEKKTSDKKTTANNPIDALKNVAALIRQESESNGPSRQSSVNSDSPATSICFASGAALEAAGAPDLTADTRENKPPSDSDSIVRPRREKTESDIVFRRNSLYNRHTELMSSGQEAVLAQEQVNSSLSGWFKLIF